MQYASGTIGRVFYIRFDHDEDLLAGLQEFITQNQIASGMVHLIGAVSSGSLVTGPREPVLPPDPVWDHLSGHELIGTGMIRTGQTGPKLHLHVSAGRGETVRTGCLRKDCAVYIVIEAVITEFEGFCIGESWDERSCLHLPDPSPHLKK
ncbi:MAG TPA: PPC domain-containing DNA-binding protein [Methanospirillum sp.]|nr:PPC domain-containing DNA-binding protein [Methanospirillum sp.]